MAVLVRVCAGRPRGARGTWLNDVWGWTDPDTKRDYALVARRDGASFVDVTDPSHPALAGTLPRTTGSPPSVWRDIKVIGNHAYIVADGTGAHGLQVFDLTRLRGARDASIRAFASKLRRKLGWETRFALRALAEYKKFLFLGVTGSTDESRAAPRAFPHC
jgi:choice-of-anchor B domain-containing protein